MTGRRSGLLFTPIRIGSLQLENRLVMAPMTTGYGTSDGLPSQRLIEYLDERARGGVGLITLEACTVDLLHREVPRSMHFADDAVIAAHRELTERIHSRGVAVVPQLVHPGPDGLSPFLEGIPSLGPSVIPSYLTGVPSRALELDEIDGIVAQFGAAARRIREAGYDGLELHAAHGYMLLGSFLSPWRNRRTDAFAGDSVEGRLELPRRALAAIRAEAGVDFPVTLRISGYERAPAGRPLGDTARIAPQLVAAGVDAFHVSGGVIDRLTSQIVTGSHYADGHNAAAAAAVKRAVDVPVMVVGRIHDPELAERILQRGQADLIAVARPLLADPEFGRKARSGRSAEIRRCISCQNCIDSMEVGSMNCAVNGRSGRELERSLERAERSKRVLVIGGGPAGLEAARLAALRGHRVTLCEGRSRLGGALLAAAAVHAENGALLAFLLDQLKQLKIEVRLGVPLGPEQVRSMRSDAVIVATGARRVAPSIPGDRLPHVIPDGTLYRLLAGSLSGSEGRHRSAWQRIVAPLLAGAATPARVRSLSRHWLPLGGRVAVVGSDLASVQLAEFLAERGRRVWLLAAADEIAPEVGPKRRNEQTDRLDRRGVMLLTGVECEEIVPRGVVVRGAGHLEADNVVLAGAVRADTQLYEAVRDSAPETFAIGDCSGPGLIRKAVDDATRVACSL